MAAVAEAEVAGEEDVAAVGIITDMAVAGEAAAGVEVVAEEATITTIGIITAITTTTTIIIMMNEMSMRQTPAGVAVTIMKVITPKSRRNPQIMVLSMVRRKTEKEQITTIIMAVGLTVEADANNAHLALVQIHVYVGNLLKIYIQRVHKCGVVSLPFILSIRSILSSNVSIGNYHPLP